MTMTMPRNPNEAKQIAESILSRQFRLGRPRVFDVAPNAGVFFQMGNETAQYYVSWHRLMDRPIEDLRPLRVG